MNQNRIQYLLQQYAAGLLTSEEQQELNDLLHQPNREQLAEYIANLAQRDDHPPAIVREDQSVETFRKIISADRTGHPVVHAAWWKTRYRWLGAAAVLLLSLSAVIYFMAGPQKKPVIVSETKPAKPEKQAGRNTAILTLADNSRVALDSAHNGLITTQGGSRVLLNAGQLAYVPAQQNRSAAISYNTITTPRGGEYTITLPDGTQVWLNAASSLKFPTVFAGDKREVELTGEAYFDVTHQQTAGKKIPFIVNMLPPTAGKTGKVEVFGTEFNIMNYADEDPAVVTLVSGSVQVTSFVNNSRMLVPGEHAVLADGGNLLYAEKADVEEETAWKNGRTYFNAANIKRIMRQISRWYDVDVQFKGNVENLDFTCTVSRKDKLSKLLNLMELTGAVHFTMEGNTIIVQP